VVGRGIAEVSNLEQGLDGEIVVSGFQLGRTLFEHHLVDEPRMVILPVVLGAGERFFGETGIQKPVHLVAAKTVGEGLVHLAYEFVRNDRRRHRPPGACSLIQRQRRQRF
jgi:dihydrofolate reductase